MSFVNYLNSLLREKYLATVEVRPLGGARNKIPDPIEIFKNPDSQEIKELELLAGTAGLRGVYNSKTKELYIWLGNYFHDDVADNFKEIDLKNSYKIAKGNDRAYIYDDVKDEDDLKELFEVIEKTFNDIDKIEYSFFNNYKEYKIKGREHKYSSLVGQYH